MAITVMFGYIPRFLIVGNLNAARFNRGQSSTAGPGVIAATQDPRWIGNWKGLELKLSDFEVVHF